ELHPLEEGMHAIGSGLDQKAYAEKVGKPRTNIQHRWYAAEVAASVPNIGHDVRDFWLSLSALHSCPKWLWRALVSRLVSEGWTVEQARAAAPALSLTGPPSPAAPHRRACCGGRRRRARWPADEALRPALASSRAPPQVPCCRAGARLWRAP